MKLTIAHLYPKLMNIYSDIGNIICLKKRCQWRGIEVSVIPVGIGQEYDWQKYDLVFGGGGQDRQQEIVSQDLLKKKKALKDAAESGVPMLTTCGTYQLFGHYFKTHQGVKIPGIGIFDIYTIASHQRKIGNIVIKINPLLITHHPSPIIHHPSSIIHYLVGFENHSGNTFIKDVKGQMSKIKCSSLGTVIKGFGNNGNDKTEGAVYKNCIGTYLHGPILPKNPHLADWLIETALERKYQKKINLEPLDDTLEWQAHEQAIKRA